MKAEYEIEWVAASPDYLLACIQEEWRQCALLEEEPEDARHVPSFATTVHEWREAMDLVWWSPLGNALNKQWGTHFSEIQWCTTLTPAREKTLRDVCNLLATQAKRPEFHPARIMGRTCQAAGVFLAIRSMLKRAGVSPLPRPSTPLEPYLRRYRKFFLQQISPLAPGGLPFTWQKDVFGGVICLGQLVGLLLLGISGFTREPVLTIIGVCVFALAWVIGAIGRAIYPGRVSLGNVKTFRGLTELILKQQRRCGVPIAPLQ